MQGLEKGGLASTCLGLALESKRRGNKERWVKGMGRATPRVLSRCVPTPVRLLLVG